MGASVTKRWAVPVLCALALAPACGCGARARVEAEARRGASERRALDEALDLIEERLLVDQARVRLWSELRDRHESVSAIAIANLDRHADAVALFGERQREKGGALAKRQRLTARLDPSAARR